MAALLHVRERELPLPLGSIDALEQTFSLHLAGDVHEELEQMNAVFDQVALEIGDLAIALRPDVFARLIRKALCGQPVGVHLVADDLLVVRDG